MQENNIYGKLQAVEEKYGKILNMQQAAEYLGIDIKTLCGLVESGELEAMEIAGMFAFKSIQLVKFELDVTDIQGLNYNPVMESEGKIVKVTKGSVYKVNSKINPFEMRFFITFDDGKKVSVKVRGTSKEEVLTKKEEKIAEELMKHREEIKRITELPQQTEEEKRNYTFREVSEMWYEKFVRANESKGNGFANRESGKYSLKAINSVIGEMDIREIDTDVAQDMINAISKDDEGNFRSKSHVEKAMRKFRRVMEYALEKGYSDKYIGKLDLNKNLIEPDKDKRFIDKDTLNAVLECVVKNSFYNTLINLILSSGLRQEEALALTIDDIRENDGIYQIYVSKAIVEESANNYVIRDRLKHNERARYVPVAKETYNMMLEYYNESIKDSELNEKRKINGTLGLIFVNKDGRVHNKRTLYHSLTGYFERNIDTYDRVTLHMFRHTFASLLKNEIPLEAVSEILGHKDISITQRFYASQTEEDHRIACNGVEKMMQKIKK